MSLEALELNYSRVGVELIERMYDTDSVLSLSGLEATERLATEAGIGAGSKVLDLGCGLGGPAMHLAEKLGCSVTGVDLVQTNIDTAQQRASDRGLSTKVQFQQGDAQDLPFADNSFDVIFSQDAWCHVPDKAQLISEVGRVVSPEGRIAFTDWVRTGPMSEETMAAVADALGVANLATPEQYREIFMGRDCKVQVHEDISDVFAASYSAVMDRLAGMEDEISSQFSPRVFAIMTEKNGALLEAFEAGCLGGTLFVADAP